MASKNFAHPALNVQADKPLVCTAMSKHLFYYRMFISVYVLENGGVPLNPFMVFDYFLLDAVARDLVREGNNNLVKRCDEIWVFGAISNGVLAEVQIANEQEKTVRYFNIERPHKIVETTKNMSKWKAKSLIQGTYFNGLFSRLVVVLRFSCLNMANVAIPLHPCAAHSANNMDGTHGHPGE